MMIILVKGQTACMARGQDSENSGWHRRGGTDATPARHPSCLRIKRRDVQRAVIRAENKLAWDCGRSRRVNDGMGKEEKRRRQQEETRAEIAMSSDFDLAITSQRPHQCGHDTRETHSRQEGAEGGGSQPTTHGSLEFIQMNGEMCTINNHRSIIWSFVSAHISMRTMFLSGKQKPTAAANIHCNVVF